MSSIMPPAKQNRPAAAEARSGRIIASTLVTALSRQVAQQTAEVVGQRPAAPSCGSEDAAQASSSTATGASISFARALSSRPLPISCSAQNTGGRTMNTPARPSSCMTRSEMMAPTGPEQVAGGAAGRVREARIGNVPREQATARSRPLPQARNSPALHTATH